MSQGVLAVVELLVRAGSHDYMVVANAISCVSHVMDALQLSISNPHAAQAAPAASARGGLAARAGGARAAQQQAACSPPPAKRACGGAAPAAPGSSPPLAMPHSNGSMRSNCAWGSGGSSGGSGGSLGRSVSMRQF